MTVLKIANFGGVLPRVSPRALPAEAAQVNRNLLATATEFRPLQLDKDIAQAKAGALTLYRMSRNPDGTLRTGDTEGWFVDMQDKSYVKGQLNDDATERTVVTFNDGTAAPRIIDATGEDRLLGVPAPKSISVSANVVESFTQEDALTWVSDTMIPDLVWCLAESLVWGCENADGSAVAGEYSLHGLHRLVGNPDMRVQTYYETDLETAKARGLTDPSLMGFTTSSGKWGVWIFTYPEVYHIPDIQVLKDHLAMIVGPVDGTQMFSQAQIDTLATGLYALINPDNPTVKGWRDKLDPLVQQFADAVAKDVTSIESKPVEPTQPSTPRYWSGSGEGYGYTQSPEWDQYDADLRKYKDDLAAWTAAQAAGANTVAGNIAAINQLRLDIGNLSTSIVRWSVDQRAAMIDNVKALVNGSANLVGLEGTGALITVQPDRIIDTRFYIGTYVTDWGEESAPCPVSDSLDIDQYSSVTLTVPAPPPGRHIQKWRLYRSNVGTDSAAYQFVDEMLISTLTYEDKLPGEKLGEPCPSMTWLEPPVRLDRASASPSPPPKGPDPYLRGMVAMPNGIVAGFIDNFVAFCDPYHTYAWPVEYQITTEHPIVGLGVFGQTLFVGTMGYPYFITGADSANMSSEKLPVPQPCVSRRSIAAAEGGVLYASPDGVCFASPSGVQVVTAELFAREDWQALNPAGIHATVHEQVYYFWTPGRCWALDFTARKLVEITGLEQATALCKDVITDGLFAVVGERIKRLFSADTYRTARWKTPLIVLPQPTPLAWVQADGGQGAGAPLTLRWWGDGVLRYETVLSGIKPKRLPPGRWLEHEVEVECAARLTKVMLTSSTSELQGA